MNYKILREDELNKIELDISDNKFYVQEKEGNDWINLKIFNTYNEAEQFYNHILMEMLQ